MTSGIVQIVIKAPNQMTDDHVVECDRLWTINQLKEHLFNEYPTHPNPENQKLIYSGKLLSDSMSLSDVLRTYGGQEYTTIHLVCSIRDSTRNSKLVTQSPPVQQISNPTSLSTETVNQASTTHAATTNDNTTNHGNLIRRQIHSPFVNTNTSASEIQYAYSQEDMAQQRLFIQQAYLQYMTNYIYMANNGRFRVENQSVEPPQNEPNNRGVPQTPVEPEVEEDAGAQRDWLEWIYIMTRLVVLFSVVYFYSSPLRFIVVMTMALFLFNMDVDRWRRRQDDAVDAAQGRNNDRNENGQQQTENQVQEVQRTHPLNIVSTFVTSFFLSLIPEQRAI